jgi:hypothetical protein
MQLIAYNLNVVNIFVFYLYFDIERTGGTVKKVKKLKNWRNK